jgi:alpha,alpha-trehalase
MGMAESKLADYGIIGDGLTAALVDGTGSIDWCCWPQFDSPAVFCRLLDKELGGCFRICPCMPFETKSNYRAGTNVLETVFQTETGVARLTDFMPIGGDKPSKTPRIMRGVEGVEGCVEFSVSFRPSFDYARKPAHLSRSAREIVAYGQPVSLTLSLPHLFRPEPSVPGEGRLAVTKGNLSWFILTDQQESEPIGPLDAAAALQRTAGYWRQWIDRCSYDGPYKDIVARSALVLKLLTFEPSGAVIAAPTTSLPEEIGGQRNWDYRYCWLRDAGLVLDSLQQLGYHDESVRFFDWLESLFKVNEAGPLRVAYSVTGDPVPDEELLTHLSGYLQSRPVRIGNAAKEQVQLDVYGAVLDVVHLCFQRMPRPMNRRFAIILERLIDEVMNNWQLAEHGLWEIRGDTKHYLHSKLFCWVAMDRAIQLGQSGYLQGDFSKWQQTRDEIRKVLLGAGYNERLGAFTQTLNGDQLDASVLRMPLVHFLSVDDTNFQSTLRIIETQLVSNDLVRRYRVDDGLPGREGNFLLCSFWLTSVLALSGRVSDARRIFERAYGCANYLGLLSEEVSDDKQLLGNFPQAFTHLGLIRAALHIHSAEKELSTQASELWVIAARRDR